MRTYILKRLLLMIPTLLVISVLSYGLMRLAPGDPIRARGANFITRGSIGEGGAGTQTEGLSEAGKLFRKRFHLDKPVYVGYWYWLVGDDRPGDAPGKQWGVLRGDFGRSITVEMQRPVLELILERMPPTIRLNILSIAIIYMIAVPVGIYAAVFRATILDRGSAFLFLLLYSLPSFWVGLLLIILAARLWPAWPIQGLDSWQSYVLPVFCLSFAGFAFLSRIARVGMLDVIRQDYIRTARAKGLPETSVILKHALRNALIPLITLFAGLLPTLVAGSILIEYLFGIPGMGSLSLEALSQRDYPVLMTLFGMSASLTLLGILGSDILYVVVDPRISYD